MIESSRAALDAALQQLAERDRDAQTVRRNLERERRRKARAVRSSVAILACLGLLNLHFIYSLTAEFRSMIHSMVSMYEHFGRVADRMDDMTDDVVAMEREVRLIPLMSQQTASMKGRIVGMAADMDIMADDVERMRQRVAGMNRDMSIMAQQFHRLNTSVGAMGVDVRQMADIVP